MKRILPFLTGLALVAALAITPLHAEQAKDVEYETALNSMMVIYQDMTTSMLALMPQMLQLQATQLAERLKQNRPEANPEEIDAYASTFMAVMGEKYKEPFRQLITQKFSSMVKDMYRQNFTRQEVIDIYKFYQSPTGRSVLAKTPVMMKSVTAQMPVIQGLIQKEAQQFMDIHGKEIAEETARRMETQGF